MMEPGIDLIVVNYKTPGDLECFGESYLKFPGDMETTLYVVNNDPEQEDIDIGEKYADVHIHGPNLYYSGSANLAASKGNREVIGILNADTRLLEGTLDNLYEEFMSHDDWGVAGPLQIDDRGLVTHGGIFGTLKAPKHRSWHSRVTEELHSNQEAVTVSGSAYFIKRSVWEELSNCEVYCDKYPDAKGAFLPTNHYYEETWCSYHAQAHEYKVIYFGESKMIHLWHKASPIGGWSDQQMPLSKKMFRDMCDYHPFPGGITIPHD